MWLPLSRAPAPRTRRSLAQTQRAQEVVYVMRPLRRRCSVQNRGGIAVDAQHTPATSTLNFRGRRQLTLCGARATRSGAPLKSGLLCTWLAIAVTTPYQWSFLLAPAKQSKCDGAKYLPQKVSVLQQESSQRPPTWCQCMHRYYMVSRHA